ncbi:tRNA threonylcarbamoyladenosine dehydratase [Clostridia bacterium]|nr:tRNA threonylcarbamoyladenosine dehydratase [Clostridia bacterium]
MLNQFSRSALMFGEQGMDKLKAAKIAVFGIGGVGGYAVEALVRSGVGTLDLFDDDRICLTNLNRQIIATRATVGQYKVDAARERCLEINPDATINTYKTFYGPDNAGDYPLDAYDYVIDAVDTMSAKLELVVRAKQLNVPIICSMGAANKWDASAFEVADIYSTSMCPLARIMRKELRKRGVKDLTVVYSKEDPIKPPDEGLQMCRDHCICPPGTVRKCTSRRQVPASNAFVPPTVGLIIAGAVIRQLTIDN